MEDAYVTVSNENGILYFRIAARRQYGEAHTPFGGGYGLLCFNKKLKKEENIFINPLDKVILM